VGSGLLPHQCATAQFRFSLRLFRLELWCSVKIAKTGCAAGGPDHLTLRHVQTLRTRKACSSSPIRESKTQGGGIASFVILTVFITKRSLVHTTNNTPSGYGVGRKLRLLRCRACSGSAKERDRYNGLLKRRQFRRLHPDKRKNRLKTTVTGPADWEKHSANHTVTLTGTEKKDPNGKVMFEVTKIQHVSTSCKAPSQ
jgi:hypothetical protein